MFCSLQPLQPTRRFLLRLRLEALEQKLSDHLRHGSPMCDRKLPVLCLFFIVPVVGSHQDCRAISNQRELLETANDGRQIRAVV
jgi:hypothetical protein